MAKKNVLIAAVVPARPRCVKCGGKLQIKKSREQPNLGFIYRYCVCARCGQSNVYREEEPAPEEEFLNGLDGPAGEAASNAFLEELTDFTPRPWKDLLKKALETGEKTREKLGEQMTAYLSNA